MEADSLLYRATERRRRGVKNILDCSWTAKNPQRLQLLGLSDIAEKSSLNLSFALSGRLICSRYYHKIICCEAPDGLKNMELEIYVRKATALC